jgi:hypothetical protein
VKGRILDAWNGFWFSETRECPYGIFRVIFMFGVLLQLGDWIEMSAAFATLFPPEFSAPSLALRVLHLGFPPVTVLPVLKVVVITSAIGSLVGLATRYFLFILGTLLLYLGGVVNSWGFFDHSTALPVIVVFVLAFAPGIDRYSLDALLARWRGRSRPSVPEAAWAARLVLILLALTYLGAGLAKVRFGQHWSSGTTLAFYLDGPEGTFFTSRTGTLPEEKWRDSFGLEAFTYDARDQTPLAHALGRSPTATRLLSVATVAFELSFPLALLSRRVRLGYMLGGCLFHLGIWVVMHLDFTLFLFIYSLFVDWPAIGRRLARTRLFGRSRQNA